MEHHNNRWGKMISNSKMSGSSPIRLTSLGGGHNSSSGGHHNSNSNNKMMQSTPLARLSPSSELSHQTPRILTLHDISGKPLPSALLMQGRQSERSLLRGGRNGRLSPSTSSSSSSASDLNSSARARRRSKKMKEMGGGGFEPGGSAASAGRLSGRNSSMVSTPLESLEDHNHRHRSNNNSSRLRKKKQQKAAAAASAKANSSKFSDLLDTNTDLLHDDGDSSSDSPSENDSFTCSEYEYDAPYNNAAAGGIKGPGGGNAEANSAPAGGGMIFRKLTPGGDKMRVNPADIIGGSSSGGASPHHHQVDLRGSLTTLNVSDDDLGSPLSSGGPASWEALLNWNPTFGAFLGVFKDIAELPDTDCEPELRPNPLGEGEGEEDEEEYI
jgi:protocadherin Fat 4